MENIDSAQEPSQFQEKVEVSSQRNYKKSGTITGLIIFLAFLSVGVVFLVNKTINTKPPVQSPEPQNKFIANSTLVYGSWTNSSSVVTAIDLSTSKEVVLATLGYNVKHIEVINNHEILYINKTDQRDYGKELSIRSIENGTDKIVISADEDFGIDNYVVSPNGQYIAIWMVGSFSQSSQFAGSPSRVYSVNVANLEKHLIYDESSSNGQKVHYPIAITNSGELFTDRFLPNSGAGWAYGMSVSDFEGVSKQDIDSMRNGTYGSQPEASPDGKYLGFVGYEGTDGATVVNGFRKALTGINTVELFDLSTQTRTRIDDRLNDAIYPSAEWDRVTGKLIFKSFEKAGSSTSSSTYSLDTATQGISKISVAESFDFIAALDSNNYLLAQRIQDNSWLGNLGSHYSQGISKLSVMDTGTAKQTEVPTKQAPIQLITIKPSNYFPIVEEKGLVAGITGEQLQLKTFAIKQDLGSKRDEQQNNPIQTEPTPPQIPNIPIPEVSPYFGDPSSDLPRCRDLGREICNRNTDFYEDLKDCIPPLENGYSPCADSPLYMYGSSGTNVKVTIDTHTNNSNVSMTSNSFNATLTDGKISVGSSLVDSISFDYESRVKKLLPPTTGYVLKKENVTYKVGKIASEFGLNIKETQDLLHYAETISSPYIFVSFYDQEMSHSILPLYFDPKPDNYRNIVFYFKKLDSLPSVLPFKPQIKPISRNGFTAIEISYMVR